MGKMEIASLRRGPSAGVDRQKVWRKLESLVREVVGGMDAELAEDTLFDQDLRLESVQVVEIQVALEDAYDLELDQVAVVSSGSLGGLLDYLVDELSKAPRRNGLQ